LRIQSLYSNRNRHSCRSPGEQARHQHQGQNACPGEDNSRFDHQFLPPIIFSPAVENSSSVKAVQREKKRTSIGVFPDDWVLSEVAHLAWYKPQAGVWPLVVDV
jgi:hypothetical protein